MLPNSIKDQLDPVSLQAYIERESLFCLLCSSNLRVRSLAAVTAGILVPGCESLVEALDHPTVAATRIAEINAIGSGGSMHQFLEQHDELSYSEFRESTDPGSIVKGVRHEDLTRLSYPDASLDLILTSDTLEHIPASGAAFSECHRVLSHDGTLVFTVPMTPLVPHTRVRATVDNTGQITHNVEPQYHGRGSGPFALLPMASDMLAFVDFGLDVIDKLGAAGLEARVEFADDDHARSGASAVVVAKRA